MSPCSADLHSVNYTHYGVPKTRYTSSATASCTLKVVREVKNKLEMILLGLKACGIGLNLTAANCVPLLPDLACISLSLLRHFCHV